MKVSFAALALALFLPGIAQAAPANDAFSRARTVSTMPYDVSLSTSGATLERKEAKPTCGSSYSTVWFKFVAKDRLPLGISTFGSSYNTIVGVYTGTRVDGLRAVACDDNGGTRSGSVVAWDAVPGTTYMIQVGSAGAARGGTLKMRLYVAAHRERGREQAFNLETPFSVTVVGHPGRIDAAVEADAAYCLNTLCIRILEARADADRAPSGAGSQNACATAAARVTNCPS